MIRIVFVITGLSTGGAEAMLLKLLEQLDRKRFTPHVISLTTLGEVGPRISALGIGVEALGMSTSRPDVLSFLRLVRRLRALRPDVVQTWMYHADLIGGLAARCAGVSALAWAIRNTNLSAGLVKRPTLLVVKALARLSRRVPAKILSCSVKAGAAHVAAGYAPDKIEVIPNGFDLARFAPDAGARRSVREEFGLSMDTPLVGMVARFDPQKNHLGFCDAAAAIVRTRPDVHFLLTGAGVDTHNTRLVAALEARGLAAKFRLLGRRDDIPRLMASLDVLASPSHGEAFPNVLGEAMACGVSCVVTDVGDSAQIVGDYGRVVCAGDMAGMAREIVDVLSLMTHSRHELGLLARRRVAELYEIGQVTRLYEKFFEQLNG